MTVPVYERREQLKALPGVRMSAPGGAEAHGAGVAAAFGRLAERGMQIAEDIEDTRTLEAFNAFKRDVSSYHHDPGKGVLNRLGKETIGLYSEAETWMDKRAEEYIRKMGSPRMVQNFRKLAGQTILSQGEQNSLHEAKQIRAYRQAESEAAIQTALDEAVKNWQNDTIFEESLDSARQFYELQSRHLGDEARKAGLLELESRFAAGRLGAMIQADPITAEAWYKANKEKFTGEARVRAEAVLEKETKAVKVQAAVDELTKKFGPDSESKGLAWIRKNYSGDEENDIASAFKTRIAEMEASRSHGEAQRHKWQAANYEALYKEYWANDVNPPRELLDKLLSEGKISVGQHRQGVGWILSSGARAGTEKLLQKRMGNEVWLSLPAEDRERAVMREMGTTEEERAGILAALAAGAVDGSISDEDIQKHLQYGKITRAEAAYYRGLDKKFSAEQKAFTARQKAAVGNDIRKIFGDYEGAPNAVSDARTIFAEKIAGIGEASKSFREDVLKARREAVAEAIENSGHALTKTAYLGMGGAYTAIGRRNERILETIDDVIAEAEEYRPEVYDSLSGKKARIGNEKDEEEARRGAIWNEETDDGAINLLSGDISGYAR